MPLSAGDKLGHYEITSLLGQGGMGEVYRARDATLKREVALKVLPAVFLQDGDRAGRFQREAEVLASLEHPNIGHIYGIVDAGDSRALALALIEGPTLADRIAAGVMPPEEAIHVARQIVEALEYAHERGVVHRDLKPANIKITPEGVVKVLDFGLAKVLEDEPAPSSLTNSPTITMGHTRSGVILGTAAYMSPEQAVGRAVDRRSDIFSFGAVLYEMLTGQQAFPGATTPDVLEAVVKNDPDWSKLPPGTPRPIEALLRRCLLKDRKQRLQAIGEARIVLENPTGPAEPQPPRSTAFSLWWAISAVLLVALAGVAAWILKPAPPAQITRFALTLDPGQAFTSSRRGYLAISPDGRQLAYLANLRVYLRSMSEADPRPLTGAGANLGGIGFSPDSKSLAGYENGALWRIPVAGGTLVEISKVQDPPLGISWSDDGIVFAEPGQGIVRISPDGRNPEILVTAKDGEVFADPQMLPGGKAVLFTRAASDRPAEWDKAQITVQVLKSQTRKALLEGSAPRYLPTGQLVYAVGGVLFAQPFDPAKLETSGSPVEVVRGVARNRSGAAAFATANNGSLVYVPGPASGQAAEQRPLGRADRSRTDSQAEPRIELLNLPPASYAGVRVSRDGGRIAYEIQEGNASSIWIYELSGASAPRRLTLPGAGSNRYPIWSPDGQWIAFQSDRGGDPAIWRQHADGSSAAERLTKPDKDAADLPDSWSADGQTIAFTQDKGRTGALWTYSLRDKKASTFAAMPGESFTRSVFSPDGHWLAYQSNQPEASHIYVRAFPSGESVYVVPENGNAHFPMWSADGKELFFVHGQNEIGSVSVTTRPSVSFGRPMHFKPGVATGAPAAFRNYDLLPNGQFLGVLLAARTDLRIQVVLNWFEELTGPRR